MATVIPPSTSSAIDALPYLDKIRDCTTGGQSKASVPREILSIPDLKSVLIIGGCGFLGLHLIEEFWRVTPRPEIHVFDIRPLASAISKTFYTFDPSKIHSIVGDITSPEDVATALKTTVPQVVVHCVSPVHGLGPQIYHTVNVVGTQNVITQAKKDPNVRALVYTSSAGTVFNGEDLRNVDESIPFPKVPMDAYNETKAIAEVAVLKAATDIPSSEKQTSSYKDTLLTVALRPAGIFGPGDRQMIPELRKIPYRGQHTFQIGNNLNLFDVTYVGNVAYAHALAAQKLLSFSSSSPSYSPKSLSQINGECFFITNDSPIYFWALGRAVWKADGFVDPARVILPRSVAIAIGYVSEFVSKLTGKAPGLTPFRVRTVCADKYYNIDKAKKILGYKPQTELQQGIDLTLKWLDELNESTSKPSSEKK